VLVDEATYDRRCATGTCFSKLDLPDPAPQQPIPDFHRNDTNGLERRFLSRWANSWSSPLRSGRGGSPAIRIAYWHAEVHGNYQTWQLSYRLPQQTSRDCRMRLEGQHVLNGSGELPSMPTK